MSEYCHQCRERPSKGSIGRMRLCYECCALATGKAKRVVRSQAVPLQLVNGKKHLGYSMWVPDFIAKRVQAVKR